MKKYIPPIALAVIALVIFWYRVFDLNIPIAAIITLMSARYLLRAYVRWKDGEEFIDRVLPPLIAAAVYLLLPLLMVLIYR